MHDSHTGDAVFHSGIHIRNLPVHILPGCIHLLIAVDNEPCQEWNQNNRDNRQGRIDIEHDEEGANECHDSNESILWPMVGEFPYIKQVIRDSAHHMTCFRVIKETEGLALDMVEQLLPHIGLYICSKLMAKVIDDKLEKCAHQVYKEQQYPNRYDHSPIAGREQIINKSLDRNREGQLQDRYNNGAGEINDK